MRRFSKTICLVVLCCFAWTASAGIFCCYQNTGSTFPLNNTKSIVLIDSEKMGVNCHSKTKSKQASSIQTDFFQMNDCNNMSACGSPNLVTTPHLLTINIAHQTSQHPFTDQFLSNVATPPTPPPKIS